MEIAHGAATRQHWEIRAVAQDFANIKELSEQFGAQPGEAELNNLAVMRHVLAYDMGRAGLDVMEAMPIYDAIGAILSSSDAVGGAAQLRGPGVQSQTSALSDAVDSVRALRAQTYDDAIAQTEPLDGPRTPEQLREAQEMPPSIGMRALGTALRSLQQQ